ncbi:MAG: hypothetical protein AAFW82_05805 [Pseudomonadota bacterium]
MSGSSRYSPDTIYFAIAIVLGITTAGMYLLVPEEIADYVSNGFMLPALSYSLLLPLTACGFVLSSERPVALAANLAVLISTLWFGFQWAETIIFSDEQSVLLILGYPIVATTMALTTGGALLLPLSVRRWLVPVVCAICGLGLSLSVVIESPGDDYSGWFLSAGSTGGMAVVITSIVLVSRVKGIGANPWFTIAERILGSWLIAASLMLVTLATMPKRPYKPPTAPLTIPDGINMLQEP